MPWMLLILLLALSLVVFAARFAPVVDDAARARTAADAAALAGAAAGEGAARELAGANGGELVSYRDTLFGVEVVVQVGAVRARAEAQRSTTWELVEAPD